MKLDAHLSASLSLYEQEIRFLFFNWNGNTNGSDQKGNYFFSLFILVGVSRSKRFILFLRLLSENNSILQRRKLTLILIELVSLSSMAANQTMINDNQTLFSNEFFSSRMTNSLLTGLIGLMTLLTIFGNSLVIIAFLRVPSIRTYSNYFILNLSIADLLIGLIWWVELGGRTEQRPLTFNQRHDVRWVTFLTSFEEKIQHENEGCPVLDKFNKQRDFDRGHPSISSRRSSIVLLLHRSVDTIREYGPVQREWHVDWFNLISFPWRMPWIAAFSRKSVFVDIDKGRTFFFCFVFQHSVVRTQVHSRSMASRLSSL